MKPLSYLAAMLIAGSLLPACATVARGTKDVLVVDTVPPGARVTTTRRIGKASDGTPRYAGCDATPCEIRIPRRSAFLMTITHDGYEPVELGVTGELTREALRSNLATSGKLGLANGAMVGGVIASMGFSGGVVGLAGITTAGIATGGTLVASTAVDAATGALLNLNPNPIVLELAPEGTELAPHPKAVALREKWGLSEAADAAAPE